MTWTSTSSKAGSAARWLVLQPVRDRCQWMRTDGHYRTLAGTWCRRSPRHRGQGSPSTVTSTSGWSEAADRWSQVLTRESRPRLDTPCPRSASGCPPWWSRPSCETRPGRHLCGQHQQPVIDDVDFDLFEVRFGFTDGLLQLECEVSQATRARQRDFRRKFREVQRCCHEDGVA